MSHDKHVLSLRDESCDSAKDAVADSVAAALTPMDSTCCISNSLIDSSSNCVGVVSMACTCCSKR